MPQFDDLYGPRLNLELNSSDSNTLYTSTRRQQGINDGIAEFAALTECYTRQSSISISCGTTEYLLLSSGVLGGSTDFTRFAKQGLEYRVRSSGGSSARWLVWLTGDDFPEKPLEWRNRQYPGWRMSTSPTTPSGYYRRADGGNLYFGLDATPKVGSSERAEVLVPYVARPVPLASSTDVPFTVGGATRFDLGEYHQAAVHYAAYKLLPLIGDEPGSQSQLQKFLGYVTRFFQNQRPKGGTQVQLSHNYLRAARRGRGGWADRPPSNVPNSQWS